MNNAQEDTRPAVGRSLVQQDLVEDARKHNDSLPMLKALDEIPKKSLNHNIQSVLSSANNSRSADEIFQMLNSSQDTIFNSSVFSQSEIIDETEFVGSYTLPRHGPKEGNRKNVFIRKAAEKQNHDAKNAHHNHEKESNYSSISEEVLGTKMNNGSISKGKPIISV